eukprot:5313405-Prymnesium_polylepis.1
MTAIAPRQMCSSCTARSACASSPLVSTRPRAIDVRRCRPKMRFMRFARLTLLRVGRPPVSS